VPFRCLVLALWVLLLARPQQALAADPRGVWPLDPRPEVVARFDPPDTPFGAGHRGVDLAGRPGQWVRSTLAGRVTFAGVIGGRGVVVVDHGATRTTYQPVAAVVAVGDVLQAGDQLGLLVVAGSHCFPAACLHWGWLRGSAYLDPLRLVGESGPIRLWPWEFTPTAPSDDPRVASGWDAHAGLLADWLAPLERWGQALGCACW